ncbi:hypothetical protein MTO96_048484 [Rhipicephalus appendiculatus]
MTLSKRDMLAAITGALFRARLYGAPGRHRERIAAGWDSIHRDAMPTRYKRPNRLGHVIKGKTTASSSSPEKKKQRRRRLEGWSYCGSLWASL